MKGNNYTIIITIILLSLGDISSTFAQSSNQTVYRTTADGTWEGANWTPTAPPADLNNVTIIIEHSISYKSESSIFNWNTPTGEIVIADSGELSIHTNNNRLFQTKGFVVTNNGKLKIDVGQSSYKIEKGANLINHGKIELKAGIIDFRDDIYAALFSNPTPSITAVNPR